MSRRRQFIADARMLALGLSLVRDVALCFALGVWLAERL